MTSRALAGEFWVGNKQEAGEFWVGNKQEAFISVT